jgi:hypothetical protein
VALSRAKRFIFAIITLTFSAMVVIAMLLAVDLYLHKRAERSAGLNIWGYRGPTVGAKRVGEVRVVVLGGSTAFGYGVMWDQALPPFLERELRSRLPIGRATAISVVNLGMNNEGAYAFPYTLRDFEFLDYDVVVLYEGYNDVTGTNRSLFRHTSPVFRVFGYYPILPLVIEEKRLALTYGDLGTAYRAINGEKVTFTPPASHRAAAAALGAAEIVGGVIARQLDRLAGPLDEAASNPTSGSCPREWIVYCDSTAEAITYVLQRGGRVVMATQPYFNDAHRQQQAVLRSMLQARFHEVDALTYVDLGNVVSLKDPAITFDGMHLNGEGNERVAHALAPTVAEAIAR